MQSTMAEYRPIITPHRLSMLPPAVLADMVVRQTLALEGLLRGGADGRTSSARIFNAATALEDAYRLEQVADTYAAYVRQHGGQGSGPVPHIIIDHDDTPTTISPRVAAACLIAVIGIIALHWAWSATL